jgi:hypothetical protein
MARGPPPPKDNPELNPLREQVRQDADELYRLITIELAAGNQMDQSQDRLTALTKVCKEENANIRKYKRRFVTEAAKEKPQPDGPQDRAEGEDEGGKPQATEEAENNESEPAPVDLDAECRQRIAELEKQLRQLYAERAKLQSSRPR